METKVSPIRSPVPSTSASSASARKLKFESPLAVEKLDISFHTDVHQDIAASVSEPVGNCIINYNVLQSMFDKMLCGQCANGRISLKNSGTRSGCAHYVLRLCDTCNWARYYWTVRRFNLGINKLQRGMNWYMPQYSRDDLCALGYISFLYITHSSTWFLLCRNQFTLQFKTILSLWRR